MKKVLLIFGTRPEAIKMCPLVKALRDAPDDFEVRVCVTGQHRQMLVSVLETFKVIPDYDLSIMRPKQSLYDVTSQVLNGLEAILDKEQPDVVLVHGDTTTSFAAGLAAFYKQIPVGHVEAGLRTNNMMSPFPEEFNRQAVDLFADYYFAPTTKAKENLLSEGKVAEKIFVTGNTSIDALTTTVKNTFSHEILEWSKPHKLILITAHRRENLGRPMEQMFRAILRVIKDFPDTKAVYPIHMNPQVREIARNILGDEERIRLVEPLEVVEFHNLMAHSHLILTDSGGIQEEAPSLGVPVLVMRDTTERPEGLEAGTLKLVGTDEETIYEHCRILLEDQAEWDKMANVSNPYGDGYASQRIVDALR